MLEEYFCSSESGQLTCKTDLNAMEICDKMKSLLNVTTDFNYQRRQEHRVKYN